MIGKVLTGILVFSVLFLDGFSQDRKQDTLGQAASSPGQTLPSTVRKPRVNVTAGTQFWSASGYGSGFSTYVMPSVSYPVGKRLSIGGGIGIINTSLFGVHNYLTESSGNLNTTSALVYITGQYLLNDRLTITGTAFKEFNVMNPVPGYNGYRKTDPQGAFMKVDYKINDFMHIEAGIGYSQGVNPYYSPFMGPSVFGGDPFQPTLFRH